MLAERPALPRVVLLMFVACAIAAWRSAPSRMVFVAGDDGGFDDREAVVWPLGSPFEAGSAVRPSELPHWGLSNCRDYRSSGVIAVMVCDARTGGMLVARIRNGDETYWKPIGPSMATDASELVTLHTKRGDVHAMKVTTQSLVDGQDVVWEYEFLFGIGPSKRMSVYEPFLTGRMGHRPIVSYRIEITEDGIATFTGTRTSPDGTRSSDRRSGPLEFP